MVEMTIEQSRISRKNRHKAREYFGIIGQPDKVLHHKDHSLRHNNIERYILWLPEDLEVLDRGTHSSLHDKELWQNEEYREKQLSNGILGKGWVTGRPFSDLHRQHISESLQGHEPWNKGIEFPHNEEWNNNIKISVQESYNNGRISASQDKTWFNNGVEETYAYECPEGYTKGRLPGRGGKKPGEGEGRKWFNNGIISKWTYECPEGFIPGRLKKKR